MMQNFSYHTHTNSFGIFDGRDSAAEMIKRAEEIGYKKLGISNHLCFHPNVKTPGRMFFTEYNKAVDIYKRVVEEIRLAAEKASIPVYVGFEVDFFPSAGWRNIFEKFRKDLNVDYFIGATHFLRESDESGVYNLYHLRRDNIVFSPDEETVYLKNYWENVIESVKSGYFDFIAHLDVCKIFGFCLDESWDELKYKLIETLAKYKQPYELNTSGWNKCDEQHPHLWMLEELNKRNVPVILSDDAHSTDMLAQHFERAEQLLESLNYKNRYIPEF